MGEEKVSELRECSTSYYALHRAHQAYNQTTVLSILQWGFCLASKKFLCVGNSHMIKRKTENEVESWLLSKKTHQTY